MNSCPRKNFFCRIINLFEKQTDPLNPNLSLSLSFPLSLFLCLCQDSSLNVDLCFNNFQKWRKKERERRKKREERVRSVYTKSHSPALICEAKQSSSNSINHYFRCVADNRWLLLFSVQIGQQKKIV